MIQHLYIRSSELTIYNSTYLNHLKILQQSYANLPWYKRAWLSFCSFSVFYALWSIDTEKPTIEQVNNLFKAADEAWFHNSIFFTFLNRFREAVQNLSFSVASEDSKNEVSTFLTLDEVINLASTSITQTQFFKPMLDVRRFLLHAVQGSYDKVVSLLLNNSDLLTQKGKVTDYSDRTFYNISGFQYALWALDKNCWIMMLECIPRNEEGLRIAKLLVKQYKELKEEGVTYAFKGNKVTEQHFDFDNTIIAAMKELINGVYGDNQTLLYKKKFRQG